MRASKHFACSKPDGGIVYKKRVALKKESIRLRAGAFPGEIGIVASFGMGCRQFKTLLTASGSLPGYQRVRLEDMIRSSIKKCFMCHCIYSLRAPSKGKDSWLR